MHNIPPAFEKQWLAILHCINCIVYFSTGHLYNVCTLNVFQLIWYMQKFRLCFVLSNDWRLFAKTFGHEKRSHSSLPLNNRLPTLFLDLKTYQRMVLNKQLANAHVWLLLTVGWWFGWLSNLVEHWVESNCAQEWSRNEVSHADDNQRAIQHIRVMAWYNHWLLSVWQKHRPLPNSIMDHTAYWISAHVTRCQVTRALPWTSRDSHWRH